MDKDTILKEAETACECIELWRSKRDSQEEDLVVSILHVLRTQTDTDPLAFLDKCREYYLADLEENGLTPKGGV